MTNSASSFASPVPAAALPESETRKPRAQEWFWELHGLFLAAFEGLEARAAAREGAGAEAARFTITPTERRSEDGASGGGGLMAVLRGGRVFEKVGVNVSAVHGPLSPAAQKAMAARQVPGIAEDPRFWACGVSLVAHMRNPRAPAFHKNTRMFWTPGAWWFGGGSDLNPAIPFEEDTAAFHAGLKAACDRHEAAYYPRFKAWADEYFFIPHRGVARGVGGIFYDDLNTGDWEKDFAFTRDVGRSCLAAFVPLAESRSQEPFTPEERERQLIHRGRYAEFNLLYDRGTRFGLESGHNPEAVLMSLPPEAKWP